MAANLHRRGVASLGKRFVSTISSTSRNSASISSHTQVPKMEVFRRAVHTSVYDKNPEDYVQNTVVPDEVIQPQSNKYWAPHPQTGVFGPDSDNNTASGGERSFHTGSVESVLEQKAFFRPNEDLEKPPPQP